VARSQPGTYTLMMRTVAAPNPRVTQLDAMVRDQLLVKMPHIEIEVLLLVQAQHLDSFRSARRLLELRITPS
jgi:hypothetical protein